MLLNSLPRVRPLHKLVNKRYRVVCSSAVLDASDLAGAAPQGSLTVSIH